MIYLILSIASSVLIFLIFKLFAKFSVNNFQAIIVNYYVAALLGFILVNDFGSLSALPQKPWFNLAVLVGFLFIGMFYVIALTTQKVGISVASVASKMSLVIPIIIFILYYGEFEGKSAGIVTIKLLGIVAALVGVYFTAFSPGKGGSFNKKYLYLPIILFLGTGLLDTIMGYADRNLLSGNDADSFIPTLFLIAAAVGSVMLLVRLVTGKSKLEMKSVIAGILLGIPNYGSIYFLLKTLAIDDFAKSEIFPINNMSIVAFSALFAFILFRERLSIRNWMGILLSIIAIGLITYDKLF
jgi:drug/metabolite transporter (DMT)-like permease